MTGRNPRPRYLCLGCGQVAAWSEGRVCARCQVDQIRERINTAEGTGPFVTPQVDVESLGLIHLRWLERQPDSHPWKQARRQEQIDRLEGAST